MSDSPQPAGPTGELKYPLFARLGTRYPHALEARYERILRKIEELWNTPDIDEYFTDLLIDKRGGRQGFPSEVLQDIITLRDFCQVETLRKAEYAADAQEELQRRHVRLEPEYFFHAIETGNREQIDLFLRAGYDISRLTDDEGTPPLVAALKKGHTVVAKILVNGRADVNAADRLKLTPLLVACGKTTQGFRWIAEALIQRGALVNVRDALGNTPLMLAITGGNLDIARHLVASGADVSPRTRRGDTALTLAQQLGTPEAAELVKLLRARGAT